MKFPSLKSLAEGVENTLKRFPLEVLFALTGTIAATVNIELLNTKPNAENWCIRLIMIGNLGLLLSLAATLFTESKAFAKKQKWAIKIFAALLAISLLFIINPGARQADTIRFFLLSLAFHLLVAFAAFTTKGHIQGFWHFNKTLFLRILISALYGGVLYLGLAAAIGSMNFLFNFKFEWDTFVILWIWIVGIFTTVFFLSGVPANIKDLDNETAYPKGLKAFTQYVLIPLATVYVIILLAYEVKIIIAWNLPKGLVSNLILGYAVFGILSLLLVYPIREQDENKWLKTFARTFYLLLIPLLVLLFFAVGTRVFRYGITEYRYFLILLALWLLFISIYFLVFKKQNIKLIPVSLAILTLFSVYGPQSAFSVSQYSQRRILIHLFEKNQAYKRGKLVPVNSNKISAKDYSDMAAKLQYLINQHDLSSLQPYLNKDLNAIKDSLGKGKSRFGHFVVNRYELHGRELDWAVDYLGLNNNVNHYDNSSPGAKIEDTYQIGTINHIVDVHDYDYMINANGEDTTILKINGLSFRRVSASTKLFVIHIGADEAVFKTDEIAGDLLKRNDLEKYRQVGNHRNLAGNSFLVPDSLLTFTRETKSYKITFLIDNLNFNNKGKKNTDPTYVAGTYLIKKIK